MDLGLYNNLSVLEPFTVDKRNTLVIGTNLQSNTELLERLALDDIYNGSPVVFVDPTGESTDEILKRIPKQRQKDVLLFDPARQPFALNVFADILGNRRDMFASTVAHALKGLWFKPDDSTPTFDMYLRAVLYTALSVQGTTFYSLEYILTDDVYRKELLSNITDTTIHRFWEVHEQLKDKDRRQAISSTYNKLNAFAFNPVVRNCLDQRQNKLVFKDKIVLVSLRTRELGIESARLLGTLILALLYIEDVEQNLYINGSRFGTAILGSLLSTCPHLGTVIAIQFLDEVRKDFQPTLLGGIGQIVAFRTSYRDAVTLAPDFNLNNDHYSLADMDRLGHKTSYACIDGHTTILAPLVRDYPETHQADKIIARCLSQCTAPLSVIENRIARFARGTV